MDEASLKELKTALQAFMKKGETLQLETSVSFRDRRANRVLNVNIVVILTATAWHCDDHERPLTNSARICICHCTLLGYLAL